MQVHDDLAALLAKNLTLAPVPVQAPASDARPTAAPASEPASEPATTVTEPPKIVYSISQHYTHSAHVKPAVKPVEHSMEQQQQQQQQEQQNNLPSQRPFSGPPMSENQTVELLLIRNGIDPTALSPVQIALFKMSSLDRQDYLLQLWKASPPVRGPADDDTMMDTSSWGEASSIEKETYLAQLRMQHKQFQEQQQQQLQQQLLQQQHQQLQQQQAAGDVGMSMDTATQAANSTWPQVANTYMEPYMMSGYSSDFQANSPSSPAAASMDGVNVPRVMDVYSHFGTNIGGPTYHGATDPVYNNRLAGTATNTTAAPNRASWPSQHHHHQSSLEMENQYGSLMAMRESNDMEF